MEPLGIARTTDARWRALAEPARRHLLRVMEDLAEPTDVDTLARAVDLHANTVRSHLEVLAVAGLVRSESDRRGRPGRPRLRYAIAEPAPVPTSLGYRLLASLLARTLSATMTDPGGAAIAAGRDVGRELALVATKTSTTASLQELLVDLGFEPGETSDDHIDLVDCPFRDVAKEHADVVCSLHLGILQGATDLLGGDRVVSDLRPFHGPSICRVELGQR